MTGDLFDTFSGRKAAFNEALQRGEKLDCPCCGRYAQRYRRRVTAAIALALIKLFRAGGDKEFIFYKAFMEVGEGADFCVAKYFGLVEAKTNDDDEKRTSGFWRLTPHGVAFVENRTTIKEVAVVFDDKVLNFDGDEVSIEQALKKKFNYSALMSGQ